MKLFEGKTKSERNKLIAAMVLGAACLIVLFFAFGRGIFGGKTTTVAVKPSPSPKKTNSANTNPGDLDMPSLEQQMLDMTTQPVVYEPSRFGAPDPGRNIFAFYEPPKPTPYVPTPEVIKPPPPQTPTPTPDIILAAVNPQSVYAGSNGFRLEIAGDRFTPDTKIYFDQQELPSSFISGQRMTADIPGVLIRNEGNPSIMAQTADGMKRSLPMQMTIQPPPKPTFQYIGMIARKRANNDTAYFKEPGKEQPMSARLNDIVGGRFRLVSISAEKTVLQDVSLEFNRVTLPLYTPPATASSGGQPGGFPPGRPPDRGGFPGRDTYTPNPGNPAYPAGTNSRIPGIPDNIPRYIPPASNSNSNTRQPSKQDVDDDDGIDK